MIKILVVCAALVFYTGASNVNELTATNFDTSVKMSRNLWIVEFYSPTCPYCKEFEPEYEQVANALQGTNIMVGRIDGVRNDQLSGRYNIHGYPTVKLFKPDSAVPEDYNGPRKSSNIVETVKALSQEKKIRGFGDVYLNLPQTRRIPNSDTKRMNFEDADFQ